ncbi:MAG: hypothetical protein K6E91_00820, partial [Butyrivibrio sp.]|nr:hypothetical protein [Butyrivibrio sp.]
MVDPQSYETTKQNYCGSIGTAVDYLTRFHLTGNLKESFAISISGATRAGKLELAEKLLEEVNGLDKKSIIATVKLASFDVFVRNPIRAMMSRLNQTTNVSDEAIYNIQIMVKRCLQLFDEYGPITGCHLLFTGAYTKNISSGDADYITADTIWDIKTSKKDIGIQDTYQILLYYLLSQHSDL